MTVGKVNELIQALSDASIDLQRISSNAFENVADDIVDCVLYNNDVYNLVGSVRKND